MNICLLNLKISWQWSGVTHCLNLFFFFFFYFHQHPSLLMSLHFRDGSISVFRQAGSERKPIPLGPIVLLSNHTYQEPLQVRYTHLFTVRKVWQN
jgi:hypothetical protein